MTTQEPIDPTAKNPNQSTGPTSETGKQTSSKNALKHGSCSLANLILERESIEDFRALEKSWFQGYGINPDNPETEFEAGLIRGAARADWFFQRSERNYAEAEANIIDFMPDPLGWTPQQHNSLQRFLRYRTANLNILAKQRKLIEDYRKNRAAETTRAQTESRNEEKMTIAKARLETYQQKNQPEPTWEEHFEALRQKAIRLGHCSPDVQLP